MDMFKRKSLNAALLAVGALGAAGVAQAVNLNPNGLGQVLIYPYYTVNSAAGAAYSSLLSVVNSTNTAKAVKVRFLEARNSREVLDFNLFLSAYDVWTAAIVPSPSGGARVATTDQSCILPVGNPGYDSIRVSGPGSVGPGVDFVNFQYAGSNADNGPAGLERTREGYVEIIEMATYDPLTVTAQRVTHVRSGTLTPGTTVGVPADCNSNNDTDALNDASPVEGGLFGGMQLLNVSAGNEFTEDAIALDHFADGFDLYFPAGDIRPTLEFAAPFTSVVFDGTGGTVRSVWGNGRDAVSAVLMRDAIYNEYILEPTTRSGTDWVVTMPTKRFYVGLGTGTPAANGLFEHNFSSSGSCDTVAINIWNREEQTQTIGGFSPPQVGQGLSLCWEANVLTFNQSNVLGSALSGGQNVPTPSGTGFGAFNNGWARIGFPGSTSSGTIHRLRNSPGGTNAFTDVIGTVFTPLVGAPVGTPAAPVAATYVGLPVVGFAAFTYTNGFLPGATAGSTVLSNYGGNFVHKSTTLIGRTTP